jgi:hypothetical protein
MLRHLSNGSNHGVACLAAIALLAGRTAFSQAEGPLDFEKADSQVVRLSPSGFPQLPAAVRRELIRRGCTIPQVSGEKGPHNVIKGSFTERGELDWAVLCSVNRVSTILVFPRASASHVIELAQQADIDRLQSDGGAEIGYFRQISPVGSEFIMQHYQAYGGIEPPPIDHQGIDDAFVGKASVVLYFYRGQWQELTGAD